LLAEAVVAVVMSLHITAEPEVEVLEVIEQALELLVVEFLLKAQFL
jgi:hypothetical protein